MSAKAQTILFFGDSLTASYNVPLPKGWVNLLKAQWQESHPELSLINASVSGETTAGGLQRLPQALEAHQPDIVWLELGANDGLQGMPLDIPEKNLTEMIRLCQAQGAQVLLAEMYIPPNYGPRYTRNFVTMYEKLANKFNVTLVPFFLSSVAAKPEFMFADGIHPNTKAQKLIAQDMAPVLLAALESE